MALAVTLLAGAFFLVGAAIAWKIPNDDLLEDYSIAIAFGSLICVVAIDLAPEAIEFAEEFGWLPAIGLVAGGVLGLIALDHLTPGHGDASGYESGARVSGMTFLAVFIHNLAEGAAIYAIASQNFSAGLLLALGVGLHNAPMGILLCSLIKQNLARGMAILVAVTLSSFAGGLIMFALGNVIDEAVLDGIVCVALGMIAYISFAELLPAMIHRRNLKRSLVGVIIGAAFVIAGSLIK